jgi:serine/threonine protein kinase
MLLSSPDQFLAALRTSSILSASQINAIKKAHDQAPCDVCVWVRQLIDQDVLTEYQADQILAGYGGSLVLGQYRILDRLGAGGMGQVYKAEHLVMKRVVALKIIAARPWIDPEQGCVDRKDTPWRLDASTPPPTGCNGSAASDPEPQPEREFRSGVDSGWGPESGVGLAAANSCHLSEPDAIERYYREVQMAAQLDHPNIVKAYDAAEVNGLFFLVMEYVEGIDLGQRVAEEGPLPVGVACNYVRQVAMGLQYAHERGLVHRDIKPSNLLVTRAGLVKILDLGLARLAGAALEQAVGASNGVHGSGLAGTPDYIAPETAEDSRKADIRGDLYSLGCTFYFLLTGDVPFPGGGWTEKLLRHRLDSAPSVYVVRPEVPAEVAAILQRLMAKDPAERYATPAELAAALQDWLSLQDSGAVVVRPPSEPVGANTPSPDSSLEWSAHGEEDKPLLVGAPASMLAQPAAGGTESIPSHGIRRWRLGVPWPVAVAAAVVAGLLLAWFIRRPGGTDARRPREDKGEALAAPSFAPDSPVAPTADSPGTFVIEGSAGRYATLAAAVKSAPDKATIIVQGTGPIRTAPVTIRAKSIIIKAAEGSRPRLVLAAAGAQPWQPLLSSDRDLTLEGLELFRAAQPNAAEQPDTAHLVYCEDAALRLTKCRLYAPGGAAPVVCRRCPTVHIHDCRLSAAALAVCIETGNSLGTEVDLARTQVDISAADGAALSLWVAEDGKQGDLRLTLEGNALRAGRIIALRALPQRIDVTARGNRFSFGEALLSYASFPEPDGWRRATAWRGEANVYEGGAHWLCLDGAPTGARDLTEWRALWGTTEQGSRQTARAPPEPMPVLAN